MGECRDGECCGARHGLNPLTDQQCDFSVCLFYAFFFHNCTLEVLGNSGYVNSQWYGGRGAGTVGAGLGCDNSTR